MFLDRFKASIRYIAAHFIVIIEVSLAFVGMIALSASLQPGNQADAARTQNNAVSHYFASTAEKETKEAALKSLTASLSDKKQKHLSDDFLKNIPQSTKLIKGVSLPKKAPKHSRKVKGDLPSQQINETAKVVLAKAEVPAQAQFDLVSPSGEKTTTGITQKAEGADVTVSIEPPRSMKAGKYTLRVVDPVSKQVTTSIDYAWGVLAFNPDYAVYPQGVTANLSFGVLDDAGRVICDAGLVVKITDPAGMQTILGTGDKSITVNEDCYKMEETQKPDYEAHFKPSISGTYQVDILASTQGGERTLQDTFSVDPQADFYLKRTGPTRTYYPSTYNYSLGFTAVKAGTYTVVEKVPASFTITGTGFTVAEQGETKLLQWNVTAAAGETKNLTYKFKGPAISPYLFFFGGAEVQEQDEALWLEPRQWMLASDNACTSNVTSGNWNAAGSWTSCGGTVPQPTDSVTIADGHTITLDVSASVTTVTINGGSTGGVLTNNGSPFTLTLTGTSGTLFTVTSPGTFTPGTSITTTMNPNASVTLTSGAITFFDLNLTPTLAGSGKTYTFGSGALTINGNFNIAPVTGAFLLTVNMGADITVDPAKTTTINGTTSTSKLVLRPASTDYNLSTGKISLGAQGTLDGTSSSSTITLTATSGTLFTRTGTFTQGTTEVIVASASGTPILMSGTATFHRLTIDSTATVINVGAVITMSSANAANRLYIKSGVFNDEGRSVVGTANGTFVIDSGAAFCQTGTVAATNATCDSAAVPTTASTFPTNYTNGNITFDTTSTYYVNGNATTTISGVPTYGNLTLRPILSAARAYTFGAAATIAGNFNSTPTSGSVTTRALTVNLGGSTTIAGSATIQGRTTTGLGTTTFTTTASNFALTVGSMNIVTSSTFTMNAATVTFNGTSGTLLQRTGTFSASSAAGIVKFTPDASVTLTDNSTYSWSSVQFAPVLSTDRTYTLGSGTITYNASGVFTVNPSALNGSTTAKLTVNLGSNTSTSATQTMAIGATQTGGSVITSRLDTTGSNRSISTGFLSITAGGELKANASTITLTGTTAAATLFSIAGSGVFTAGTSTVTTTGVTNANVINSAGFTGSNALYNLTINNTGITKSLGADIEVTNLTTVTLGTLDLNVTNNYTLTTRRISLANSASAFILARASTIYLTATSGTLFTKGASGTFTAATSEVVVNGAGTTTLISAAVTFHRLTINNAGAAVTAGAVITMSNANATNRLYIQAGILDCVGNTIVGTANGTFVVDAGAVLELGSAAATANFPTNYINANITLDVASTVIYQSGIAQNVSGVPTYGNLQLTPLSGTPVKTLQAALTVNGNFDINGGSFVDNAFQITGSASKTFTMAANTTLCLGGTTCTASSTTATTFPTNYTNGNITLSSTSTVSYLANNAQTISSTPTYGNVSLIPVLATTGKTYTFASGTTTVNGNLNITPITGAFLLTVNMGGDIIVDPAKTTTISGTTSTSKLVTRPASTDYNLTTGKVSISAQGTLDCTGSSSIITLTATSGTLFTKTGTFTVGTSEVIVTSASGTPTLLSVGTTFHKLTINTAATVINDGFGVTINNVSGARLYIQAGVFNGSASITGPGGSNGTLQIDSTGTLCLGGTAGGTNATCDSGTTNTASRAMPTFQTYSFDPDSTVRYMSNVAQTVLSTVTYGNLVLAPKLTAGRVYTLGTGALTVNGNFSMNPTAGSSFALTVNPAGNMTVASGKTTTVSSSGSARTLLDLRPGGSDFNLSTGLLIIDAGSTLDGTSSSATVTLTGTAGVLFSQSGTYTIGTTSVIVTSASGTPTLLSDPTTFHRLTINAAATSVIAGAGITMSNASAANRLYIQVGTLDDDGSQIVGTSNGTLLLDAGTFLKLGDGSATTFPTNYTSGNITLNDTSSVVYNASTGQTISSTPTTYGHLQLATPSGSPTKTLDGAVTVNGNLTIDASNTLDVDSGNSYAIILKGNFTNNGVFTARSGLVTLSGTSTQTLTGNFTTTSALYDLTISNSSGTNASDCELTGFVASVSFASSLTSTHIFTAATASTRIQFNSGSTYSFTDINWNGQATGSRVYLRNSAATGSWLLNVSGTQTATIYLNVSRSDASGGNQIAYASYSTNCGNNTNWVIDTIPDAPTSLLQKKVTGGATLSTGDWTNENQVTFTATATDPDATDTLYLCVEKDTTATNFSNTEDLCGSGVAYSGAGVTVEVTITGITDASEYHWQARVKDAASFYSTWDVYGGNSDVITAARDFGVDTTAPTGGTVYDGTSGDQNFNDGSLTELSGNWTGFTSGASGLQKYQFALRRQVDNYYWNSGTTSWQSGSVYTDNGTALTATVNPINLQTGTIYYVSVIAVDNAGNSSSPIHSDGQHVQETLSFSPGVSSITFANLNNTNSWMDTQTSVLSTSTNASNGYSVKTFTSALFADIANPADTVPNFTGTGSVPLVWSNGTYGFGYTTSDTTIGGGNPFAGGTKYAGFTQSAPGETVADHTDAVNGTTGAVVNEQFTVTYKAAVSPSQTAATYRTFVTYIVSANF